MEIHCYLHYYNKFKQLFFLFHQIVCSYVLVFKRHGRTFYISTTINKGTVLLPETLLSVLGIFNKIFSYFLIVKRHKLTFYVKGVASSVPTARCQNAGAVSAPLRQRSVCSPGVGQTALSSKSLDLWNLRKVILQRSEPFQLSYEWLYIQVSFCHSLFPFVCMSVFLSFCLSTYFALFLVNC